MNGKGDTPRPMNISQREYDMNWERIFKSNEKRLEKMRDELQADIDKVKAKLNELTLSSQEKDIYDASSRSEVDTGIYPRVDEDGNHVEHTAC